MSSIISVLSWIIANWSTLASAFSAIASVSLFFMHGNNAQEIQELKDFINSINVSQNQPTAQDQARNMNPKV
jgi:hypothetical protein